MLTMKVRLQICAQPKAIKSFHVGEKCLTCSSYLTNFQEWVTFDNRKQTIQEK